MYGTNHIYPPGSGGTGRAVVGHRAADRLDLDGQRPRRPGHLSDGAFELELQLVSAGKEAGFELLNSLGEKVKIYLDASEGRVVMDRAESGIVDFGKKVKPHDLDTEESYARYKEVTVNYKNDFALGTWAPINTAKAHKIQVFVDNGSVELFVDGGRVAMTNLVFPNEPYNSLRFYSKGGEMKISNFTIYKLGL